MSELQLEEGDSCPCCEEGVLIFKTVNCSCHISPPCNSCLEGNLECDFCGEFFPEGMHKVEDE
jgi:hypothetical protein